MPKTESTLHHPFDAIMFDCDGTMTAIEGIDRLAEYNDVAAEVIQLTAEAMGQSGLNLALYQKRLDIVKPSKSQLQQLAKDYIKHATPNAKEIITLLKKLDKAVYFVSAGLSPAVITFGEYLGFATENIFAVDIFFNENNTYRGFDESSPLTTTSGKKVITEQLKKQHQRIVHIGDGLNDLAIQHDVDRLIGYGGHYYRPNIEASCEVYIKSKPLKSILPYILTLEELAKADRLRSNDPTN